MCHDEEHPRSRGENQRCKLLFEFRQGTSPLARGKLVLFAIEAAFVGNIPARAGKTLNNQQISVPSEEFYITQLDEHVEHDAAWLDLTTPVVIRHHL